MCTQSSMQHREMCRALIGMGVDHAVEHTVSGYAVDIVLPDLGIAIEVDGPTHFACTDQERLLGSTAMKHRHLRALGFVLFLVSSADFELAEKWQGRIDKLRALIHERQASLASRRV